MRHTPPNAEALNELFQALKPVHKLRPGWQTLLAATVILKNCGKQISIANYPRHSCYIVRNGDLPPMEQWETELIAALCLHQKGGKLEGTDLPFREDRARWTAYQKPARARPLDRRDRPGPPGADLPSWRAHKPW